MEQQQDNKISLVKKLSEVMKQVKYIEKKGFNKFHGYKYATESDVAEKVREVLAEQNVMLIPNLVKHSMREHTNAKGKTEYIVAVDMEFKFYDGDSGEELTFHMSGEGQDAGDKGIYKAITGAQKYALMKVFMIPTGDDPEADNSVDERNESYSKPELMTTTEFGTLKTHVLEFAQLRGKTEGDVYKALNITDITLLTSKDAKAIIAKISGWIASAKKEIAKANKSA
jgi:hypothetical protein